MRKYRVRYYQTLFAALLAMMFMQQAAPEPQDDDPDGGVYIIHVEGLIDNGLYTYIERGLERASSNNATGVILYVDTFGGLVEAADNIRKKLIETELPTVAFIDKNAASAGALISIAADSIFMSPGSSIGAATVVDGQGTYASEKMQSYMRGIMRATAEAKGRDPRIAEAMVDESVAIEGVIEEGKLLTLSTEEAVALGFADASYTDLNAVIAAMGWQDAPLIDMQELWAESVLRFLANPVVSSILMLMMLGGLYFELQTPGVGFPGTMAAIGAILFFSPLYIMGLAESWEIVLFFVGVGLLIVEIFIIPGFGLAGISGISLVIFSLGAALIGNIGLNFPELNQISNAVWTMAVTLVLGIAMIASFVRYLPENTMFNKLVLSESSERSSGYTSSESKDDLLGEEGITITALRPSGTALIQDRKVDVVSDGDFVEKGARIKVVETTNLRVMVRKLDA
jgi:membrane-bound serine protease (ClpP class)